MTFAERLLKFYTDLQINCRLPDGIEVLNPYQEQDAFEICKVFYRKYYNDNVKRYLILGINPGRYGAGITGIPFTDPVKLESILGIKNNFPKKPELSADFIHSMIASYGGPAKFFSQFFINSVSPLGFIRAGKNLNYYDDPVLKKSLEPFIHNCMQNLLELGIHRNVAFCLGEGENYKYLQRINKEQKFFEEIVPLAHPRFIMQYKRKHISDFMEDYLRKLNTEI
jgi:hypothetical protein